MCGMNDKPVVGHSSETSSQSITMSNNKLLLLCVTVSASQASGLLALGCLLLEENLIRMDTFNEAAPSKCSRTLEPSTEENFWLILAE
jgi:hypothetical protein